MTDNIIKNKPEEQTSVSTKDDIAVEKAIDLDNGITTEYVASKEVGLHDVYKESGSYKDLSVGVNVRAYNKDGINVINFGAEQVNHHEELDPTDKNTTVGSGVCGVVNLCVPTVNVPQVTKNLSIEYDNEGNPIPNVIQQAVDEIIKQSNDLLDTESSKIPDQFERDKISIEPNTTVSPETLEEYKLSNRGAIPITTQTSVPCKPETEAKIPELDDSTINSNELDDLLDKLEGLMNEDLEPINMPKELTVDGITDRTANGKGTFDALITSLFVNIQSGMDKNIFSKTDAKEIIANSLPAMVEQAIQFNLQKDQAYWQAMSIKAQMISANTQNLIAKAELLTLPSKLKLAYAQLQAQLKQVDLVRYQIELEKYKIPQIVAQTDQVKEQTALICQQRKLAIEQLAQADLDRAIKDNAIIKSQIENQILNEQFTQSKEMTKQNYLKTDQLIQQVKLNYLQVEGEAKNNRIKDAQLIQMSASLKIQAQQLLKDREQISLYKAQIASSYANVTALMEQIKAAKAQYSDTIDGVAVGGVLGAQIKVNKAQAIGFERSAFNQFVNTLQSGWTAKKTADIATLSPNGFNALGLDRVLNWYATKLFNMPNETFKMPEDYTDYLSDAAMDGTSPTPNPSDSIIKK